MDYFFQFELYFVSVSSTVLTVYKAALDLSSLSHPPLNLFSYKA